MYIYAIYALLQTGKLLPSIISLVVVLSVFFRVITAESISAPAVILTANEGWVLDEQRGNVHRFLDSSIGIVALCLLLLALCNSLFSTRNGCVQLFECAVGIVVDTNFCCYICTDGFSFVKQILQLHGSLVGRYCSFESINADTAGLNGSEPVIVSGFFNHLPLCTGTLFKQVQTSVGEVTLPAEELVGLCGYVGNEVVAVLGGNLPETVGIRVVVGPDTIPCVSKGTDHGASTLHVVLQLYHIVALSFGVVGLCELNLDTTDGLAICCTITISVSSKNKTCTCGPVVTVRVEQVTGHVVEIHCLAHFIIGERCHLRGCNCRLLPDVCVNSFCDTTAYEQQCAQNE